MQEFDFQSPQTLDEVFQCLAAPGAHLIAGGTDVIPRMRAGIFPAAQLIDLNRVEALRYIREEDGGIRLGALTTYAEILRSPLLAQFASALGAATRRVASPMARQRGTLGGNLANASPAADSVPPLLVLDSWVRLAGPHGMRELPLTEFFRGPGKTVLAPDEIIESIFFHKHAPSWGFGYEKLGPRQGMTISILSAAAALELGTDGRIKAVRIALGAAAPTPVRCPRAEQALLGHLPAAPAWQSAAENLSVDISPIDDVRASGEYRRKAAGVLVTRALQSAAESAQRSAAQ